MTEEELLGLQVRARSKEERTALVRALLRKGYGPSGGARVYAVRRLDTMQWIGRKYGNLIWSKHPMHWTDVGQAKSAATRMGKRFPRSEFRTRASFSKGCVLPPDFVAGYAKVSRPTIEVVALQTVVVEVVRSTPGEDQ